MLFSSFVLFFCLCLALSSSHSLCLHCVRWYWIHTAWKVLLLQRRAIVFLLLLLAIVVFFSFVARRSLDCDSRDFTLKGHWSRESWNNNTLFNSAPSVFGSKSFFFIFRWRKRARTGKRRARRRSWKILFIFIMYFPQTQVLSVSIVESNEKETTTKKGGEERRRKSWSLKSLDFRTRNKRDNYLLIRFISFSTHSRPISFTLVQCFGTFSVASAPIESSWREREKTITKPKSSSLPSPDDKKRVSISIVCI